MTNGWTNDATYAAQLFLSSMRYGQMMDRSRVIFRQAAGGLVPVPGHNRDDSRLPVDGQSLDEVRFPHFLRRLESLGRQPILIDSRFPARNRETLRP